MPVTVSNRLLRWLIRFTGWAIVALLPVYCLLMTELIHFSGIAPLLDFLERRGSVVAFDLGDLYLLWLGVLCLCRKGWIATILYAGVFGLASLVNYLKYAMTGDYFYPWDLIQQAGNVGELTRFITVPFPPRYLFLILFGIGLSFFVWLSGAQLPLHWKVRLPGLFVLVFTMFWSVSTPAKVTAVLNRSTMYLETMCFQSVHYKENGFIGAFTVNLLSSNVEKPDGYGKETVDGIMEGYQDSTASDSFREPDIVLVLSESFWDPQLLPGTVFSRDPLDDFRALCAKPGVISGRFFTTGFGGGTVRPEFEVLSGLSSDYLPSGCVPWQYVSEPMETYISLYHDLGYLTTAIHPYTSSFYCRKDAYPLIGFDNLCFLQDIYNLGDHISYVTDGGQVTDYTFVQAIEYHLDQEPGVPKLIFGISMENHQPYPNKYDTHTIEVSNSALDEDTFNAVLNFTEGAGHADDALARLSEFVLNREKDTILIWFGDHLPTLGSNLGAYHQTGVNELERDAYYEYLYSTPFVICANFELDDSRIFQPGTENAVATYNLMNGVSELIGSPRTAYMEFLADYYATIPYSNVRLLKELTPEEQRFADAHRMLTYDRIAGSGFSLD